MKAKNVNILGVRVDKVTVLQASSQIEEWLKEKVKKTVFTPNVEFVMAAQSLPSFKEVLNKSDLNIPDSSRFSWAIKVSTKTNPIKKFLVWSTFLLPKFFIGQEIPVTTGVDLMENLLLLSNDKGYRVGFLGGRSNVAKKLADCLKNKYKDLKISYIDNEIEVDKRGEMVIWKQKPNISQSNIEILFVAFGHIKQELFIDKNKEIIPAKIFMGVGGSLDYISGVIPRAPKLIRKLELEWLFRLLIEPWRIKRFGALIEFIFLVFLSPKTKKLENS